MNNMAIKTLRRAGLALKKGRALRLAGNIASAVAYEQEGEKLLKAHFPELQDDLLTVWEGSMNEAPFSLAAWMIAKKNAQSFYKSNKSNCSFLDFIKKGAIPDISEAGFQK